jgi:hypothetical protein
MFESSFFLFHPSKINKKMLLLLTESNIMNKKINKPEIKNERERIEGCKDRNVNYVRKKNINFKIEKGNFLQWKIL